ncbi:unnamed protein product [Boreogadus saida]
MVDLDYLLITADGFPCLKPSLRSETNHNNFRTNFQTVERGADWCLDLVLLYLVFRTWFDLKPFISLALSDHTTGTE